MPFNQGVKKLIVIDRITGKHRPCVMCGKTYPLPDAVHIIDQQEWKKHRRRDMTARTTEFPYARTVIESSMKCSSLSCIGH